MKRLLLLTFLCVVPSAQAVDYVKCEAMQKASGRLRISMESETTNSYRDIVTKAMDERPVGVPVRISMEPAITQYDLARKIIQDKYQPRLDKIQADYDAAGCY